MTRNGMGKSREVVMNIFIDQLESHVKDNCRKQFERQTINYLLNYIQDDFF